MPTATLTTKGQVTLPKQVRERLGVDRGDQIEFVFERDGSIRLRRSDVRCASWRVSCADPA